MFSFHYNLFKRLWHSINLACLTILDLKSVARSYCKERQREHYKTTMSAWRVPYVKLSWVICTMKYFLFISLKFTSWEKTCCIQNHMQTFLFIFRAKAPALIHGKSLHGHWHVRRKIPKPFFSSTSQNWALEGSRFRQRHICKCGSHNVFRSS